MALLLGPCAAGVAARPISSAADVMNTKLPCTVQPLCRDIQNMVVLACSLDIAVLIF